MNRLFRVCFKSSALTLAFAISVLATGCASSCKKPITDSKTAAAPAVVPVKNQAALDELKKMGDALAHAKTMSFIATSMTPIRSANNQWVHVFATAKVAMERPSKISIETGGDAFPQHIIFDGATFSMSSPDTKLYSQTAMTGNIDSMLAQASAKAGDSFPFSDVLIADPLTSWTTGLEGAAYIGESTRGGEKLQHLALSAKDVHWEVWTDEKTHLPRHRFCEVHRRISRPYCHDRIYKLEN